MGIVAFPEGGEGRLEVPGAGVLPGDVQVEPGDAAADVVSRQRVELDGAPVEPEGLLGLPGIPGLLSPAEQAI
jgi:hypothetical protein